MGWGQTFPGSLLQPPPTPYLPAWVSALLGNCGQTAFPDVGLLERSPHPGWPPRRRLGEKHKARAPSHRPVLQQGGTCPTSPVPCQEHSSPPGGALPGSIEGPTEALRDLGSQLPHHCNLSLAGLCQGVTTLDTPPWALQLFSGPHGQTEHQQGPAAARVSVSLPLARPRPSSGGGGDPSHQSPLPPARPHLKHLELLQDHFLGLSGAPTLEGDDLEHRA